MKLSVSLSDDDVRLLDQLATERGSSRSAVLQQAVALLRDRQLGTDYASATMPDQVEPLLQTAGLTDAAAVATMSSTAPTDVPLVGTGGFTSSPESLADCMGRLGMTPEGPPALVVDRATFDGADVGVVVTVNTLPTDAGEPAVLDVIVVGSECSDEDIAGAQRFEYAVTP